MQDDRYIINSVIRAAKILESFSADTPSLSNSEISKRLNINKTAVTRLMHSLVKAEFVHRDEDSGRYNLTHKLFGIGSVYVKNSNLHTIGRPLLEKLTERFNENTQIGILDRTEVMYLEQVKCSQHIGLMSSSGSRLPAYCTGAGKILLSYLSSEELDQFCKLVEFKRYTQHTVVDPDLLKQQLPHIKNAGYALVRNEFQGDVLSIGAPVIDGRGKVLAAISLAGPRYRMDSEEKIDEYIEAVVDTAGEISRRVKYSGK